ncbi:Mercuric ion reductase [hydrothermal vent metagenome]|uniref:Mercuric ion reductase n=2 Tax=hydrothermal vent metagenome TaxID=652676 RepID=A0A3B1DI38_9ZZZZ
MSKYDYDLVVIGGGAGGLTASTFAGQSAAKTLLIEKEKKLGGDCLHYGCVPSKSLIKSAYIANVIRNSEKYGLPKISMNAVDYSKVSKRIKDIIGTIQPHDEPEYIQDRYNVETQFGSPQFIDENTIALNGKNITSRYFVIATGSTAFIPPIEGIKEVNYITNVEIFSLDKLPESLVVIGAGPIGMEMAQSFHRLGSKVTVVETTDCILPREDKDVSCYMHELLEKEGINFVINTKVNKVEQNSGIIKITADQEGQTKVIETESLLISTGRKANIKGLDLEKAGVAFDRVIKVNNKMQTTKKHIYAVGDVTGGYQFTHVASYEAVVAIYNAILKIPKKTDYSKTPWCTYIDPEVASIGYNERRAKEAGIDYIKHVEKLYHNDRALAEGETNGFIKILMDKKRKVIGVQIVGYHAGDLISEWIPVLNGKGKLSLLTKSIHPYPTMSEISKNASVNYLVSTIPSWTKKLTKILFGYQGKA